MNKVNINANFRFNSVGQGLFYTGIITKVHKKTLSRFVTIYDCGSTSKREFLHNAIEDLEDILPNENKVINLLTISHFDEDHVNGLPMLLSKFKVNTVIIPYISICEKLLHISIASPDNPEYSSLLSLYRDPIQFFTDYGVKNIIVIAGDEQIDVKDGWLRIWEENFYLDKIYSEKVSEDVGTTQVMIAFSSLNLVSKEFEGSSSILIENNSRTLKMM